MCLVPPTRSLTIAHLLARIRSTHTATLVKNMTTNGQGIEEVIFESKVRLNPGTYTTIAHVRWFTREPGVNGSTVTVKYDMASEWSSLVSWIGMGGLPHRCSRRLIHHMHPPTNAPPAAMVRDVLPPRE